MLHILLLTAEGPATAAPSADSVGRAPGIAVLRSASFDDDWDASFADAIVLVLPDDAAAESTAIAAVRARAGGAALIGVSAQRPTGVDGWLLPGLPAIASAELLRLVVDGRHLARRAGDAEQRLDELARLATDAIVVCSEDRLQAVNPAAVRLLGARDAGQLIGRPLGDFFEAGGRAAIEADAAVTGAPPVFANRRLTPIDGLPLDLPMTAAGCRWDGKPALQLLIRPPAERRRALPRADRLGHDRLTGLPNRSQLRDRLTGTLARASRERRLAALVFVGLDHFQRVNAAYGQAGGDRVLVEMARRLRGCTRQSDTVARLGGDEFSLTLEGLDDRSGAALAAQRALDAVAEPLQAAGEELRCSASVGIAVFPADADQLDTLWRRAELALLHAKESGRSVYRFYSAELDSRARSEQLRRSEIARRMARLTPREREVMAMLVTGKANKMVAYLLGAATRTVEKHRASIMDKMEAASLAELVRMSLEAGV